nr:MAG TPA: hypothetical protein [Inoviridae sp.]
MLPLVVINVASIVSFDTSNPITFILHFPYLFSLKWL